MTPSTEIGNVTKTRPHNFGLVSSVFNFNRTPEAFIAVASSPPPTPEPRRGKAGFEVSHPPSGKRGSRCGCGFVTVHRRGVYLGLVCVNMQTDTIPLGYSALRGLAPDTRKYTCVRACV